MFSKNNDTKKNSFEKRKQYGSLLKKNVIAGNINLKKEEILKEPKKKDLLKIIKDVQNNVSFLQREMPKIEKEYTKFCNGIQIEKQKLEEQNKKLNKERNNIWKKHEDLYYKLENCDREILELDYNRQKYLELQQQLEIYKKNQTQQIQKNIKDKEQELDNKIEQLKPLESKQNDFVENYKDKNEEISKYKECLEDFREKLKNKKQQLEELENDKLQLIEKYDETYNKKINELYVNDFKNFKQNDIIKNTIKEKYDPTLKNLLAPINNLTKDIMLLKIEYNKLEQQRDNLMKKSVYILRDIDDITRELKKIETEKKNLDNDIATIERDIMLSKQQQNKINNEYKKQSKEYQSNIEAIDELLTERKPMLNKLYAQYTSSCNVNGTRLQELQQKILNNNTQIAQLDEEIKARTKKYNNIKNAYNRAFGLYQSQQNKINNECVYGCKVNIVNQK